MRNTVQCRRLAMLFVLSAAASLALAGCDTDEEEEESGEPVIEAGDGATSTPASIPRIAMNGAGSGMAVWNQETEIWARKYEAATGWEAAQSIQVREHYPEDLCVAMIGSRAVAIWREAEIRIYGSAYSSHDGWDSTHFVGGDDRGVSRPELAANTFDESPMACAAWLGKDTFWDPVSEAMKVDSALYGAHYRFGGTWESRERLDTGSTSLEKRITDFALSMGGSGSGQAIWREWGNDLLAGWDSPRTVVHHNPNGIHGPKIALDLAGSGVAIWYQSPGMYGCRYDKAADSWGVPELIGLLDTESEGQDVALNGDGNGFAVWRRITDRGVHAARFHAGAWGPSERIDLTDTGETVAMPWCSRVPIVGVDAAGYARAVWEGVIDEEDDDGHPTSRTVVCSARFDVHGGWEPAAIIGYGGRPDLAVDARGRAIAVWWAGGLRTKVWDPPLPSLVWTMVYGAETGSNRDLWSVEFDGTAFASAPEQITSDSRDDWSPTLDPLGTRVCFVRDGEVWIVDSDGRNELQLTDGPSFKSDPTFTPDGGSIVYATGGSILMLDLSPGGATTTLAGSSWYSSPSVSPDGSWLAFASTRNLPTGEAAPMNVWIVPMDGSADPTPVTTSSYAASEISYSAPAWSPDGSKIVCQRFDGVDTYELYVLEAFGTGQTELATDDARENYDPVFTPDGSRVVYTSRYRSSGGDFVREIWWVPANGSGSAELLGPAGMTAQHPSFPGKP
jgi:hypothetical protein